jgi:hypothetical protein
MDAHDSREPSTVNVDDSSLSCSATLTTNYESIPMLSEFRIYD